MKTTQLTYAISNNGSVSYHVTVDFCRMVITMSQPVKNKHYMYMYKPLQIEIRFKRAFIPSGPPQGNSLLFLLQSPTFKQHAFVYLSICQSTICTFETEEEIIHYKSPIGNSDVPDALAISKNYFYFINYLEYLPIRMFKKKHVKDVHDLFYTFMKLFSENGFSRRLLNVNILCNSETDFCEIPFK